MRKTLRPEFATASLDTSNVRGSESRTEQAELVRALADLRGAVQLAKQGVRWETQNLFDPTQ
jgi:hypothetical protein